MQLLQPVIDTMGKISLEDMKSVRLMNRIDTKYLLNKQQLYKVFSKISSDYLVQIIDNEAIAPYRTLYLDTEDIEMYTMHHNRKLNRQKLRARCYRQSNTTFFELKNKNNKGKTSKIRIPIAVEDFYNIQKISEVSEFVQENTPYIIEELLMQLENNFNRITIVDKLKTERITIDSDIRFFNHTTQKKYDISDLVIVEVKQDPNLQTQSQIIQAFEELRIHPKRVSKYCLGTILTNPQAKANRFKEKIRYINKVLSI